MNCKISHDSFCFVCGKVNLGKVRTSVSSLAFIRRYQEKFDVDPRNRIVDWSPSMCCSTCMRRLADANRPMALVSPVQWNAPLNHPNDCYFCKSVIKYGTRKNSRSFVKYATVTSVVPAVHEEDPIDQSQVNDVDSNDEGAIGGVEIVHEEIEANNDEPSILQSIDEVNFDSLEVGPSYIVNQMRSPNETQSGSGLIDRSSILSSDLSSGDRYVPPNIPSQSKPVVHLTQVILNDIVRDLDLSKQNAEVLASRFQDLGIGQSEL